jgi:hypothetical protein
MNIHMNELHGVGICNVTKPFLVTNSMGNKLWACLDIIDEICKPFICGSVLLVYNSSHNVHLIKCWVKDTIMQQCDGPIGL